MSSRDVTFPPGNTAVRISAIDSTLNLVGVESKYMWQPNICGFDRVRCGTWCFLIEHPSGRKLVYDLGMRKDWWNCAPAVGVKGFVDNGTIKTLEVPKDVAQILSEGGVELSEIEAIIWSHFHFDHTGDPSTFPTSTKLIVGPGTKEAYMPGYPTDPHAHLLDSDTAGRQVEEVEPPDSGLRMGGFLAVDYFGDGSFYILDEPGHTIGHIGALARTTAGPAPAFIHLNGDSAHHAGEIRPTTSLPLPDSISPSPIPHIHPSTCPSHAFSSILRNNSKSEHILEMIDPLVGKYPEQKFAMIYSERDRVETIERTEALDADPRVFTLMAHDWSLKGAIDEWPKALNGWEEGGVKERSRWKFLEDFGGAVGK